MKKTFCAVLTLVAVFLFTGNLFAQGISEYTSKFFQTENIVERNKIVDEAIEKLPLAESEILVFLDSMGNYIAPFIEEFSVAKTKEDFIKSDALLIMFADRYDNKAMQYDSLLTQLMSDKRYRDDDYYKEIENEIDKVKIQGKLLATYSNTYYPVDFLFNEEAFEEAAKQIYDSMNLYKEMEIDATGKTAKPMPSYEEFKTKLAKQVAEYKKAIPPTLEKKELQLNDGSYVRKGQEIFKTKPQIIKTDEETMKMIQESLKNLDFEKLDPNSLDIK